MNENEVMNNEVETEVAGTEENGDFSAVVCGAVGAAVVVGLIYGGKAVKKLWRKHKAKKSTGDDQNVVEAESFEEVNNEEEHKENQK